MALSVVPNLLAFFKLRKQLTLALHAHLTRLLPAMRVRRKIEHAAVAAAALVLALLTRLHDRVSRSNRTSQGHRLHVNSSRKKARPLVDRCLERRRRKQRNRVHRKSRALHRVLVLFVAIIIIPATVLECVLHGRRENTVLLHWMLLAWRVCVEWLCARNFSPSGFPKRFFDRVCAPSQKKTNYNPCIVRNWYVIQFQRT